jgi:CRISPR-associated protein Cas5d
MQKFSLVVWGDFALFTRPEMKVERVSYDVMTPSSARAVLEAIFWKPAFRWEIDAIEVLKPVRWANIRRNELASVASYANLKSAMLGNARSPHLFIEDDRQQRAATLLRDVKYRIHAHQISTDKAGPEDTPQKLAAMFLRRAEKGQCVMQPYLGCREFVAYFALDDKTPAIDCDMDLGWMLHDMDFQTSPPQPRFFKAAMRQGRVDVPPASSGEVRG